MAGIPADRRAGAAVTSERGQAARRPATAAAAISRDTSDLSSAQTGSVASPTGVLVTNADFRINPGNGVVPRGELRIYLGSAAGVGKTYAMLCEGHRRRDRGTDVVV